KRSMSSFSASCQMAQVSSGLALAASSARVVYCGLSTNMKFSPPSAGVGPKKVESTFGLPGTNCTHPVSQSYVVYSWSDQAAASLANSSVVTPSSSQLCCTSSAAGACVEVEALKMNLIVSGVP